MITREEQYLNRLAGETDQAIPEPETRKEQYLSRLCGADNIIPQNPITREEQYLASLCGEEVEMPEPETRLEQYMAFAGGERESKPEPITRKEQLWDKYQGGAVPEEKTVSGNPIHVTDAVEESALALSVAFEPKQDGTPFVGDTTTEPYLSKTASTTGNKRYLDKIVGGTVAWNQLIPLDTSQIIDMVNVNITLSDNEYILTTTAGSNRLKYAKLGEAKMNHVYFISAELKKETCIVTFGFYLENGGAAVYQLNRTEENKYIAQNGITKITSNNVDILMRTLMSEQSGRTARLKNLQVTDLTQLFANAPAIADYIYSLEQAEAGAGVQWLKNYRFIDDLYRAYNAGELISTKPEGIRYGNTTHTFGSAVDLRGLYRLDANNKLYCDGDELTPDGTLKTNYDYRAYQSGDEELTDAITDGTNTVVKKVTPTTSTSETYPNPVDIENGDIESFIDTRSIPLPVGNSSHYAGEYAVQGKTGLTVKHAQTQEDTPTTYSVTFTEQGTVYGGTVDIVTGALSITWGYIASYNGETLTGRWLSSLDVYAEETTPTTGAEVAFELASPITAELTPQQVDMLLGENTVWTDGNENITLTYMSKAAQRVLAMNSKLILNKQALEIKRNGGVIIDKPIIKPIGGGAKL